MKKGYLMTPGPTPVPKTVLDDMAQPIIHHRTSEFTAIAKEVNQKMKKAFLTENPVLIFASSGTGAMESAVSNLKVPGTKALVINGGKFGERWGELCAAYGFDAVLLEVEWGKGVDVADVEQLLKKDPQIKVIYATLCETSTGVVNDVRNLAGLARKYDAILVVDAVSGLLSDKLLTDEWGVDVVVSGSQKGFMMPPGLGFVSVSERAWKVAENATAPRYYFDWLLYRKSYAKDDFPYTPSVSLMFALKAALDMILAEGVENLVKKHALQARAVREAMKAIGLDIFAASPSNGVTAVRGPEGVDTGQLTKKLRTERGMSIAGGQGDLKGKIFRIAHMGFIDQEDILALLPEFEDVLSSLGYSFKKGETVRVAEEIMGCAQR
ncbi:MAG: alanine--glyoxylate aminotransferase family protein [Candidatus Omnitrophica bacterium]|nr:alanine--glyoxylate aminotransferase family protein [Candidatus Omnitrophota bacterium]